MSDDDITRRVIEVIAKTTHKPLESITPETVFADAGIDSLDGIQILFALEQEFEISISDDDAKKIRGVADVVRGVSALLAQKTA